jgi:TolB-like protein
MPESGGSADPQRPASPAPEVTQDQHRVRDVFISYASQDAAVATAVVESLEQSGIGCWLAPRDVTPGTFYGDEIVHAIDAAKASVLILSQNATASQHVLREVERAASKGHPVISLRIDQASLPAGLEYFLNTSQWLDASSGDVARSMAKLSAAVRVAIQAPAATQVPSTLRTATPSAPAASPKRMGAMVAALIGLVMVGFAADRLWVWSRRAEPALVSSVTGPPPAPATATATATATAMIPEKSVAVLPFVDMSEKKDQEYFSDGLSEELIGLLSKVPELKVPGRTSSFYFKGKQATIADIARTLGVAHVLEGSVRRSGNTLRITAQLIRADNGYDMWSETYDRKLDDIFKVQDEISAAVVKALKIALGADAMPRAKPTANQEAYALFLLSRSYHYRGTYADVQKAIDYAEQAVKLDPSFAPAWAALGDSLVYGFSYGGSYAQIRARAFSAAQTALRLDPKLSDAHVAMGRVLGELDWDWQAADAQLQAAIALDSNNVLALVIASSYALIRDRGDEALRLVQKAAEVDSLSREVLGTLGDVYFAEGQYAEAEAAYRRAIDLNPTGAGNHLSLGIALLAEGQPAAALEVMQKETDEGSRQYGLALAYDAAGRHGDADQALAFLESRYAESKAEAIASLYACRREPDKSFAWSDRAYRQRDDALIFIKTDPCSKSLQADRRYKALLKKLNLL